MDDHSVPRTLPAALDRAARLFPGLTAYVESAGNRERNVTWEELRRRVHDTAAGLDALGLERGDRVAICAANCIDWIVAFHAIVRAGGIGVLVYFDLGAGEIITQITRPASRFLIADADVLAKIDARETGVERVFSIGDDTAGLECDTFNSIAQLAGDASRERLALRAPLPDDTAAIVYTSGTTGGAKGVMLSHRNLLSNAQSAITAIDFSSRDSSLLVLPLHHAMPLLATIVLPPLVGAKIVIENDLRRIRDRLQQHKPTIFFGVPALYDLVFRNILARAESEGRLAQLQAWHARGRRIKQVSGVNLGPLLFRPVHRALGGKLRFLVSGGAALNPETARNFFGLGLPLLQGWGMTEASPVIAVQRFSARRFRYTRFYERHVGSVGPAVPGVDVRLIDVPDKDIRVAVHGEGEVIVRGANVFQGYWQAEEATRAAKLDGWLKTGDLGRVDDEGNIYLTGRSKYVIVLDSGEKVHPDELEERLAASVVIEDLCITARSARGKTQVAAIVYPRLDGLKALAGVSDLAEASVRQLVAADIDRLTRGLAAYKRVSQIELTDTPLPKTPLRKVARGALEEGYEFDFDRWLTTAGGS
jgi:long-chain acyl-CoA synthetase